MRSSSSHSAWQSSSNCQLLLCNQNSSNNNDSCRLSSTPCFDYRTANNTSYCAPGTLCSLLEPCNNITGGCSSNMSVCIMNSCCMPQAVCLPLFLTNLCLSRNNTSEYIILKVFCESGWGCELFFFYPHIHTLNRTSCLQLVRVIYLLFSSC